MLRTGQLVVLESTTYPGTTRERLRPMLEESGLAAGRDFHLAFSPERIDPGRTDYTIRTTPKVVGGAHRRPARAAPPSSTRRSATRSCAVSSPEAAELAKLLENIFRSVNIALVNELAQLCDRMGIDIWEVVDAAATKPFGFMRFEPGPGMGGHCLPVDPFYLAFKAREHDFPTEFIELAGKINQAQPHFCVREDRSGSLNDAGKPVKGSRVALLGVSYKAGVGDLRESPALKIIAPAARAGRRARLPRPARARGGRARSCARPTLEEALAGCDVACIVTAHPEVDYARVVGGRAAGARLPGRHARHRGRQPGPPLAGFDRDRALPLPAAGG